jgi:uncharacterized MAPEG superfamily protein
VLILALKEAFTPTSLMLCQAFLVARVLYLPAYVFGLTGFRSLVWLVGFAATIALYLLAL